MLDGDGPEGDDPTHWHTATHTGHHEPHIVIRAEVTETGLRSVQWNAPQPTERTVAVWPVCPADRVPSRGISAADKAATPTGLTSCDWGETVHRPFSSHPSAAPVQHERSGCPSGSQSSNCHCKP